MPASEQSHKLSRMIPSLELAIWYWNEGFYFLYHTKAEFPIFHIRFLFTASTLLQVPGEFVSNDTLVQSESPQSEIPESVGKWIDNINNWSKKQNIWFIYSNIFTHKYTNMIKHVYSTLKMKSTAFIITILAFCTVSYFTNSLPLYLIKVAIWFWN